MAERRRLPVLQEGPSKAPPAPPDEEERPPWHWAGFGVVAIFAAWVPLSYVGGALSNRLIAGVTPETMANASEAERAKLMLMIALPVLAGLAIAAFLGGFIVGRFGTGPGPRIAGVSGGVVALIAVALSRSILTPIVLVISLVVVSAISIGFAVLGGRVGARKRSPV